MERATPTTPLPVGRSCPSTEPKSMPHTGAVEKIKPVLAALVVLRPKVNPVWAVPTPRHPKAAMGKRSLPPSLLSGSRSRRTPYMSRPPAQKRNATSRSGGMERAANLVAAKLVPQKMAASITENSVSIAALSLGSVTALDCTVRARLLYPLDRAPSLSSFMNISGWWVSMHASRAGIETRIRMACEVAEMRYGEDLTVNLG